MSFRDPRKARIGEEILPFDCGYLPEYFQKKAEAELHETPENKVHGMRILREMLKRDKRTKNVEMSDEFLLQYLRSRKFDVERAFASLKAYVNFTRSYPQYYVNYQFDEIVKTINDKIVNFMPWRCQDGCAIILGEINNWKPDTFGIDELKRMIAVFLLQSLQDPMTQVNGYKVIIDVKITSFKVVRHCTPLNMYQLYHATQECVAGRFKEIHIVNDSFTFKAAWAIIKRFFTEKLRNRMHFHSSPSTLLDFFPSAALPVAYGGKLENYDQTAWLKKVMTPEQLDNMAGGSLKDLQELS